MSRDLQQSYSCLSTYILSISFPNSGPQNVSVSRRRSGEAALLFHRSEQALCKSNSRFRDITEKVISQMKCTRCTAVK